MMNHPDRAFSFTEIESKEDLVEAMFNCRWPLCYSFYHGKLLYLNDSESEDLPEYAVMTIDKTEGRFCIHGREVGRINTTSMKAEDAQNFIHEMNEGKYASEKPVQVITEPKWHHSCQLCELDGD
jgi:hypothetical protein